MRAWTWRHGIKKKHQKTEAKGIFLNPFTVCSSCKRKFVICLFVDKETNGSYPFVNGLNGFAYLWFSPRKQMAITDFEKWHSKSSNVSIFGY